MTRDEAIQSLIRLDRPLDVLLKRLEAFKWDWEGPPIAQLGGSEVAAVIRRYVAGVLTAEEVESWANLLEGRDDVEFSKQASAAIFDLANPEIQGSLAEMAPVLLARF